jgi:hypothetical protein
MEAKSLSNSNSRAENSPGNSCIHVVGDNIAQNEKRLDGFQSCVVKVVDESQALEAAAD